jgi:hypothetical protein
MMDHRRGREELRAKARAREAAVQQARPVTELRRAPGVDNATDQTLRRALFANAHPEIVITSPRENGSYLYRAHWGKGGQGKPGEVIAGAAHEELRALLDYLEARFDRATDWDSFGEDGPPAAC